ncbi:hypothetical protein R3P38DRAFT_3133721 [Favolaschia claudopus]|uniref:Fork-head domain-containing protein n=1 Tax=Favolaschia claudopus TaxID=2862362 RepID=A0AAV9Z7A6_9AGAR
MTILPDKDFTPLPRFTWNPMSTVYQSSSTNYVDAGHYLRQAWTPPLPSGFRQLMSLILLAKLAIYGSTRGMLTLQGIINALQDRFLFFRQNPGEPWTVSEILGLIDFTDCHWLKKRSIRHFLSLKAIKGVLWTLDITQGEGDKRKRKRRIRSNHPSPSQAEQMVSNEPLDSYDASQTFDLPTSSR